MMNLKIKTTNFKVPEALLESVFDNIV